MKVLVSNIQRLSLHDGPGIRTTVFFKGCSLHCPWCANPENININSENYFIKEKCLTTCLKTSICNHKGNVECLYGAVGIWGKHYSEEEILKEIKKDKGFYKKDGGVTFSGGEPLLQAKGLVPLLCRLKKEKINIHILKYF